MVDKLTVTCMHTYEDGIKGFYATYEIPVSDSTQSRDIIKQIKDILEADRLDKFGDCGTEELASIFNVTQNTIMNWVRRDGMPMIIKSSKGYRFNKEDVFEWVKNHKAHYIYLIKRYEERLKDKSQN